VADLKQGDNMPNGGSDCCGTCWFNSKNGGKAGYGGADKKGKVRCTIRGINVPNPFYTYCANHPHHTHEKIDVPLGPVFVAEPDGMMSYRRKIWLNPPDNENVRLKLIEVLEHISDEFEQRYPSETSIEEEVINQLVELREKRAIPGLLKVIRMDIEKYRFWDKENPDLMMVKNKAVIVGQAIEALLKISDGELLSDVEGFIKKGLEETGDAYDMRNDNFAVIRYHLVRGLKYVDNKRAIELLQVAQKDPHDEVRAFANEILDEKIKPEEFLFSKGQEFSEKRNYKRAIEYYIAALKIKPDYFDILFELGNTYIETDELENSIKYYTMALDVEPDHPYALNNRGRIYMATDKYEEAIHDLEKWLALKPADDEAFDDEEIIDMINEAKEKLGGE
jgi:tetratricopeptide (TPR) repeat protein